MVGQVNNASCTHCQLGYGRWTEYVSVVGHFGRLCTNCYYSSEGARCSLRKYFSDFIFIIYGPLLTGLNYRRCSCRPCPSSCYCSCPCPCSCYKYILIHLLDRNKYLRTVGSLPSRCPPSSPRPRPLSSSLTGRTCYEPSKLGCT